MMRSEKSIEKIPWYRDIHLATKEIVVGRICLRCGKIIGDELNGNQHRSRHKTCQFIHRRERQYETMAKRNPPKKWKPKYCPDCIEEGKSKEDSLLPENKWNKPQCIRCDWHQYQHSRKVPSKQPTYRRPSREYIVLATCVKGYGTPLECGELFETHTKKTHYCPKHRGSYKGQFEPVNQINDDEIKKQIKDYKKKIPPLLPNYEKLGTFDTAPNLGDVSKMKTKPDGTLDVSKEIKHIKHLKKKTFKKKPKHGRVTEGDIIRGIEIVKKIG